MALTPGTRLGPYEILSALGAGGMGEVYRAHDSKLNRDVALKVLLPEVADNPERLARFRREAQILASLNHPNIAHIHGLDESAGITALIMELVEGDDLSERITRLRVPGASARQAGMPLDEALPIAKQIAEALEAAHEQGIIHRDLKPANIKVRSDGTVKVLDFGLAKALDGPAEAGHYLREGEHGRSVRLQPDLSASPTLTTPAPFDIRSGRLEQGREPMTQAGMILGTAAYMAPEQAKGRAVDRRADIWAFGAVLFEMLTGQRAFAGSDVQETFVAIMRDEPDWTRLPATLSPTVVTFMKRCLHKDPKQRVHDIADVRLALEGAFETAALPRTTAMDASVPRGRLAWMVAAVVASLAAIAFAVPALRHLRETPQPAPPETRTEIVTPATDDPASFALSPDGRQIVFVAEGGGAASRLWLRSLATTAAQQVAGTDGARDPFWSPDGRSIAFFADGSLKRLDLGGGAPRVLAPARGGGSGGTWNASGVILFAPTTNTTPLMRVSATGGTPVAVTALGPQQAAHMEPRFLPDGNRFLFYVRGAPDTAGIHLGALDGRATKRLTPADRAGVYLPAETGSTNPSSGRGWLLSVRAGALLAQRLDLVQADLSGEPVTIADGLPDDGRNRSAASVSATGEVAYRIGTASLHQLAWFDRSGALLGSLGEADSTIGYPRLAPDGRRVVVTRTALGNQDLWLLDGARASRLTFDAAQDRHPLWSPDGTQIVFRSNREESGDLYLASANGGGTQRRLVASDQVKTPNGWSPDGRFLIFHSQDLQSDSDLWVVPTTGAGVPSVFLETPFREVFGTFSPDGRWVAYQSNESGRPEIYIRSFVPPGTAAAVVGQWQVSTAGGIVPVWSHDGKELFYLNPAGEMMAAPIRGDGPTLTAGSPVALFRTRIFGGGIDAQQGRHYDVAPDGRFLINSILESSAAPITFLQHWQPEAKK